MLDLKLLEMVEDLCISGAADSFGAQPQLELVVSEMAR
jgi:hypothetical protein